MIAFLHTKKFDTMIGADYVPHEGELLHLTVDVPDERDGIFRVLHVMYGVPSNPGRQRVDIYAEKISESMKNVSFAEVVDAIYQHRIKQLGEGFPA